jgi:hypothetical protein
VRVLKVHGGFIQSAEKFGGTEVSLKFYFLFLLFFVFVS